MIKYLRNLKRFIRKRIAQHHKIVGNLEKIIVHPTAEIHYPNRVKIEDFVRIGAECHIDGQGEIYIGEGTTLSPRVVILSSSHNYNDPNYLPFDENDLNKPVKIGKGVWIAWGAQIFGGINIGDGAIIAGGSVVTKDVSKGEIVGGNPAKRIGLRDHKKITELIELDQFYQKMVIENGLKRKR